MSATEISLTDTLEFQKEIPTESLLLTGEEMEQALKRYHFPTEEREEFLDLQDKIREVLQAQGILLTLPVKLRQSPVTYGRQMLQNRDTMLGAITLGEGYDELQQAYTKERQVGQAYRMETLGMEYLRRCYEWFNQAVGLDGKGYPGAYHYLESAQEICRACDYLAEKQFTVLHCNAQGVLIPAKSVIFKTELHREKRESCAHSCEICRAVHCSFRQSRQRAE